MRLFYWTVKVSFWNFYYSVDFCLMTVWLKTLGKGTDQSAILYVCHSVFILMRYVLRHEKVGFSPVLKQRCR